MTENKTISYRRETVKKHLEMFTKRVKAYLNNDCNVPYPDKIKDIIIFGSYVNSTAEKIHDLDIFIRLKTNNNLYRNYADNYAMKSYSAENFVFAAYAEEMDYFKGGSRIISLHPSEADWEIVKNTKHIYVVKSGKMMEDNIEKLLKL